MLQKTRSKISQIKGLKIAALLIFAICATLLLSSCLPETPEPPPGVWRSDELNIMLYFKPEYRINHHGLGGGINFPGIYEYDGNTRKVLVTFGNGQRFRFETDIIFMDGGRLSTDLIVGDWRLRGEQIHWTLTPVFRERIGVRTIVFNLAEEYDPINPTDWLHELFP